MMIPDRTTLLIACVIAATSIARLSPMIHEALGIVYAVHALRVHRRDRGHYYDRSVSTGHVARRTT